MGASEGTFQTFRGYKADDNLSVEAELRYHPYNLRTVLWERNFATAADIFLEVIDGDKTYVVDSVTGTASKSYVFPNDRVPHPLSLVQPQKVRFRAVIGPVLGKHSAIIILAELGAV